ncbi:type II toxin-antitoxin system RelE/ParE family toxin [Pseudorhodoplanes sp.]|uniref:type II toxin-antitoxin system RelE/ParE family toxin n=1 Tax=Pseudorhodoplanes sp. TaxID=1934341 RepID=UPI003D0B8CAD
MPNGQDVVSAWYAAASSAERASLDARMVYLRLQTRESWTRPSYDTLRDGVGEVRFKARRINHRALGFFGPERNHFCFLIFATKTNVFDPRNAIETAVDRRAHIESGAASYVIVRKWG